MELFGDSEEGLFTCSGSRIHWKQLRASDLMKQLSMANLVPENSRVGDVNQGLGLVLQGQVTGRGVPGLDGERSLSLSTSLREGVVDIVSRVLDKICIRSRCILSSCQGLRGDANTGK